MSKAPLITAVETAGPLQLVITWSTGERFTCDLTATVNGHAVLAPLADPDVFNQVVIEEWGHGLDWPNGLDLGADRLYLLCREQAGLLAS